MKSLEDAILPIEYGGLYRNKIQNGVDIMKAWIQNFTYQAELDELCNLDLPYDDLKKQNILITGATGLIGSYLTDFLMHLNESKSLCMHVTVLCRSKDRAQKRFAAFLDRKDFTLLTGDVCQKEWLAKQTFDYIIHGAGNAHPKVFATQPVETMKANLLGTMNLLDYAVFHHVDHPVKQMVLLSTGEIYGHAHMDEETGWKETEPGVVDSMNVRSCYPEGKRAAETLCQSYYQEYDVYAVVARLCYIYGATIQDKNSRADAQFLRNALAGEEIIMKSEGIQVRSYCYLQDAASAILTILLKGVPGEAYNVANEQSVVSIREYAEQMAKTFEVKIRMEIPEETEKSGYSKMEKEILDASKLRALGWEPKVGIQDGMGKMKNLLN